MEPLPQEIVDFLLKNISSIEQLEILRVLNEKPEKEWEASELGPLVQASAEVVASHVIAMENRGLLTFVDKKTHLCRFGPKPDLTDMVEQLLQFYQQRPVSMIRLVYDRATIHLRTFSDSFRLKDDKKL